MVDFREWNTAGNTLLLQKNRYHMSLKTLLHPFVAILLLTASISASHAQPSNEEEAYHVAYGIDFGSPSAEAETAETLALLEMAKALSGIEDGKPALSAWFTPHKLRVEQSGLGGFIQLSNQTTERSFLLDTLSQTATEVPLATPKVYTDYVGDSLIFISSADAEIVFTEEQQTIAGYTCKKALLHMAAGDAVGDVSIWYTEELPQLYWGEYDYLERIPGLALKITAETNGMEIGIVATEIKKVMVTADWFDVPDGYTVTELEAFDDEWTDEWTDGDSAAVDVTWEDYELSDGRSWTDNGEQWGVADSLGNLLMPYTYDEVYEFSFDFAPVEKDGLTGLVDRHGELVFQPRYEQVFVASENRIWAATGGLFALLDIAENELAGPSYDVVGMYSHDRAVVSIDGKYGYVDTEGKLAIDLIYDSADLFIDGVATVTLNGETFEIDTEGKRVAASEAESLS